MSDKEVLWKRCCQMEEEGKFSEAFKCALYLQRADPKNEEVVATLRRLNEKLQKISDELNSTDNRVKSMLKFLKDEAEPLEKRVQAANNLVALVRENAGQKLFIELKGFELIISMLKNLRIAVDIRLALVRVLRELVESGEESALLVLKEIGIEFFVQVIAQKNDDSFLVASQTVVQSLLTQFTGFDPKTNQQIDKKKMEKYEKQVDIVLTALIEHINLRTMNAQSRDSLLELLMVNIDPLIIDWGGKLLDKDGLYKLLDVASELKEIQYESSIPITSDTRTHVSLVLEKVYNCMTCDSMRDRFRTKMMEFMNNQLKGPDIESKIRATAALTSLLNGPLDAGNFCLGQTGIIEMMLAMANSEDVAQQCVAAEAIIAASSKKDKSQSIAKMGTGILKTLYKSNNPKIKVRALVGLCKLSSVGGTDASVKVFSEESTYKLYKACCTLLIEIPQKDSNGDDIRKWTAEALAYLTLDADIKETLIKDTKALNNLIELGKTGDLSVLFGVVTTFVNLTNSYEKQEVIPELKELAKLSKQHVPEDHEFDGKEYVDARCKILGENHVSSALVALSRSQAKTSREMISRVFNAICEFQELRGFVVQEGGARVLIRLSLENNTEVGKQFAAQALARIAITNNPDLVFPGQRSAEVVGPIMELLNPSCSALQNFEALMALTNLSQVSVPVRNRILKDNGFSRIENYIYEEHDMLKRAATQCIANLILSDQVVKLFEAENDRVKFFVILMGEEDVDTASAASGALAMITSMSRKACKKIFDAKDWVMLFMNLLSSKNPGLQHRAVVILHNLISADRECATKVVESPLLELMMAIIRPEVDDINENIKEIVRGALKRAEQCKLIKKFDGLNVNDDDD